MTNRNWLTKWNTRRLNRKARRALSDRTHFTLECLEGRVVPSTVIAQYDFGTTTSPVARKYTPVTESTLSATTKGHGWLNGDIFSADRSVGQAPSAVTQDLNYTTDGTFVTYLPNGYYAVTARMGDTVAHDRMAVYLEGTQVDVVSTQANEYQALTYYVQVTDSQLTLRLRDLGGADPYAVINGLTIAGIPGQAPARLLGINVGGNAADGYLADSGFSGGALYGTSNSIDVSNIANAPAQSVLQSQRYGNFNYTIGNLTPGASYTVRLYFAEFCWSNAGQRVFNLAVNGTTILSNFDVWSAAGGKDIAIARQINATANANGQIVIQLSNLVDVAILNAIEVLTTSPIPAPSTPTNLTATAGDSQITLSWAASAGAISYNLYRSTTSGAQGAAPYQTGITGPVFTDTGLSNGITYYYTVAAVNSGGESPRSAEASATPVVSIPAVPGTITAVGSDSQVSLSWAAVSTATSYNIYRSTTSGSQGSTPYRTGVVSASFTDTGLTNGTTYYYKVTAVNSAGASGMSAEASAIPQFVNTNFITTPWDRIPNFGANPTMTVVHSGSWSDVTTWSGGRLPTAGDVVSIGASFSVTYDVVSDVVVKTVAIQSGGTLTFRTDVNTRLTVINLLVMQGGTLQIGSVSNPVAANVKAEVIFANVPLDLAFDPEQYGNGLIGLGKIDIHGAAKTDTFLRLAVEPLAGATTLVLSAPVSGWRVGDRLIVPDSRQLYPNEVDSAFQGQWELGTISAISADARTITLAQPLVYNHFGARNVDGELDFTPYVGNLTRNVVIRSQSAYGTRGHTFFTSRADVDIENAQFTALGRTRIDWVDSTTFNANGQVAHLGTNQKGRYSVNFSHLVGPAQPQANGFQFTFTGNAVFCPIVPMPFRWGIDIQGSSYGLIKDNVVYNWSGAGIVTEDGTEINNVIEHNYVVRTLSDTNNVGNGWLRADRRGTADMATEGVGLWFRGFSNYVRNNVATGATSYGYTYFAQYMGYGTNVPLYQGADPSQAGQYRYVDMNATPILQFEGNEAFGAMPAGMTIWWLGTFGNEVRTQTPESIVKNFRVWSVSNNGFFGYETYHLTIDGFVGRGSVLALSLGVAGPGGISSGDYLARDFAIRNTDIQGMYFGFEPSLNTGGGTTIIENSLLRNYYNVRIQTLVTSSYRSDWIPPRTTIVRNVMFDSQLIPESQYLGSKYDFYTLFTQYTGQTINYIQTDQLFVYAYNGNPNDNFQVYYNEQRSDFVIPQSVFNPDGTHSVSGAPFADLTNEEAWDQYHIAIAGAVAPANAVARARVKGLVRAF